MVKIFASILILYFLALLQTSFLVHLNFMGAIPNLVLMAVILINFFEDSDKKFGLVCGFLGGVFLDAFSGNFFGLFALICLGAAIFFKFILRQYFRLPAIKNF
jgi:rod shape-determining protein MreD